jgi:hypothetical protein
MKAEIVQKPDSISDDTWAENKRWLQLMAEQAGANQKAKDPTLYRQSSQTQLISPHFRENKRPENK